MWRTGPAAIPPAVSGGPFGAVTVEYDFLQLLLDQLSARGLSYSPAVVKEEFDFEAPADENNVDNDAPPASGSTPIRRPTTRAPAASTTPSSTAG